MKLAEFRAWLKPEWKAAIVEGLWGGLDDYDNDGWYSAEARMFHTPRTAASVRHDHIAARLERSTMHIPEIQIKRKYGHVLVMIADRAMMTIKKLDTENRLASVNKTRQSHDILSQRPLTLDDMPLTALHLVGGYTVDASGTQYELFITCPERPGMENRWELTLSGVEAIDLFTVPEAAETEVAGEPTGRVQLKDEVAEQVEKDEEETEQSE